MNSVLENTAILSHILSYALPYFNLEEDRINIINEHERYDILQRELLQAMLEGFSWVTAMRLVSSKVRDCVDSLDAFDHNMDPVSSNNLWYLVVARCGLVGIKPPEHLYHNGSYEEVCVFLLAAQVERVAQEQKRRAEREREAPCVSTNERYHWRLQRKHPNPAIPRVCFSDSVVVRIQATARALETFWQSVHFTRSNGPKGMSSMDTLYPQAASIIDESEWCQLALLRYRMFLFLKQQYPRTWLVPTVDIEFCWLVHIFRTQSYLRDMSQLELDPCHSLLLSETERILFASAIRSTQQLWDDNFPTCPYLRDVYDWENDVGSCCWNHCRFIPQFSHWGYSRHFHGWEYFPLSKHGISEPNQLQNLPLISLIPDEIQSSNLYWLPQLRKGLEEIFENQASTETPGFGWGSQNEVTRVYTEHLVPTYERFMNLMSDGHDLVIDGNKTSVTTPLPCVIHLLWRVHQSDPVAYQRDCTQVFGRAFHHDLGPILVCNDFESAWQKEYGTTMEEDWKLRLHDMPHYSDDDGDL